MADVERALHLRQLPHRFSSDDGAPTMPCGITPYFISTILFNPLVDSYVFSPTIFHTYFGAVSGAVAQCRFFA